MKNYDEQLKAIRALATGKQPDADISDLLFQQKCFYLLSLLKEPHKYTQTLKIKALLNQNNITERYRNCKEIFDTFHVYDISYAVIKGAVLSSAAYDDPYQRYSCDIDLLISRANIDVIKQVLKNCGFIQARITENGIVPYTRKELLFYSTTSHQSAPFVKETGNRLCPYIEVDLNMDILWGESIQKSNMDFVLQNTINADICNTLIHKLTPEMEFISLCLHHYKDMNSIYLLSQKGITLDLFCDIYFYIKNNKIDADKLNYLSNKLNISQYVYYCLYYTNYIFEASFLESYCKILFSQNALSLINKFGLNEFERQEWQVSFFDRLFGINISNYLQNNLSKELIHKIELNNEYLRNPI